MSVPKDRDRNPLYEEDERKLSLKGMTKKERHDVLDRALEGLRCGQPIVPPSLLENEEEWDSSPSGEETCGRVIRGGRKRIVREILIDLERAERLWAKWIAKRPYLDIEFFLKYLTGKHGLINLTVSDTIFPKYRKGSLSLARIVTFDPTTGEYECTLGDEEDDEDDLD